MTNIFVAKLDFGVSDDTLKALFEDHGTVVKCHIAKDRETGKPRGFAFIEMSSAEQAQAAIDALDGHSINGRSMVVKLAEDRSSSKPRPASGARGDNASRPPRTERDSKSEARPSSDHFSPPLPTDSEESSSSTPVEKTSKRGKNKPKKSSDKPESREFKMSAYKKSGKKSRVEFEDDDDWELELLKQQRRGWSDDEEE